MKTNIPAENKLKKLASKEKSNWAKKAQWRIDNESWLATSNIVALHLLSYKRHNNITTNELSKRLNISVEKLKLILKGNENLTLKTIAKIEKEINFKLLYVAHFSRIWY